MEHGRLPWPTPDELDEEQRRVYDIISSRHTTDDAGRLGGPFNAMLFAPILGEAIENVGAKARLQSALPGRAREMVILETAVAAKNRYLWHSHERNGRAKGLTDDEIEAIATGAPAPTLNEQETMVRRVAQALIRDRDLDDQLYEEALAALGLSNLVDLVYVVGYYELLDRSLRVWRTPFSPNARAFG